MQTKKRVLFLADINSVHTERWVKNLSRNGYALAIYSLGEKKTDWLDDMEIPWKCRGLAQGEIRSKRRFGKLNYFGGMQELRSFVQSFQPEIIHAHYASSYGMLAMRLRFPKTILSLWGSDVFEFPKRSLIHRILFTRIVASIPTVCSTSQNMAEEAMKYVKKNYHITPFGIDTNHFVPSKKSKDTLVFGTVKSLERVYGIDRLIVAFAEFQKEYAGNTELHIFGRGSEEEQLRAQAKSLDIEKDVHFQGYVVEKGLVQAFQSLDIFVALSRRESFGVAVLEAQSCGLPVIVANIGGLPEVVNENTGVLVNAENSSDVVKAMHMFSKQETRNVYGEAARNFVVSHYGLEETTQKMISVYEDLV